MADAYGISKPTFISRFPDGSDPIEAIFDQHLHHLQKRNERLTVALDDCLDTIAELESRLARSAWGHVGESRPCRDRDRWPSDQDKSNVTQNRLGGRRSRMEDPDSEICMIAAMRQVAELAAERGARFVWRLSDGLPAAIRGDQDEFVGRIAELVHVIDGNSHCKMVVATLSVGSRKGGRWVVTIDLAANQRDVAFRLDSDLTNNSCSHAFRRQNGGRVWGDFTREAGTPLSRSEASRLFVSTVPILKRQDLLFAERHPLTIVCIGNTEQSVLQWQSRLALLGYLATAVASVDDAISFVEREIVDLIIAPTADVSERLGQSMHERWSSPMTPSILAHPAAVDNRSTIRKGNSPVVRVPSVRALQSILRTYEPCVREL